MRTVLFPTCLLAILSLTSGAPSDDAQPKEAPAGFQALFNGKDLTGWQVIGRRKDVWGVDRGLIYVKGSGGGWLMTDKEYSDFELRLGYKVPVQGNSGVAIRSPLDGRPSWTGMEIQILDDPWYLNPKNYKEGLKRTQLTGSIYGVVPPSKEAIKPAGEWNAMRITARGRRVTVEINGTKVVDANLDDYKQEEVLKDHPGILRTTGHLGLQSHDGRVEFRDVYVKSFDK
jgi:hypothetical protein